jgi:hypothetical protein
MPICISIAGPLLLIHLIAVVFASLRATTDLRARAMFTLAIANDGVSLLGMLYRRATWAGVFGFGVGYLTLCCSPYSSS